eukprot:GILI01040743.1.p1 GENE.GILI01040743.1~~GILI01040743.1.p1  ORF type:complete len:120 (+),score=15.68 GILI01040743.1:75-434(+)
MSVGNFVLAAVIVVGICASTAFGQTYTLNSYLPYDINQPIRVTINAPFSSLIVNKTFVRLALDCTVATPNLLTSPTGTVGNIIGYTSGESRPVSEPSLTYWNVQFTEARGVAVNSTSTT